MVLETKEKIYTTTDAAKFLGLEPTTVRKLVQRGLLIPHQQIGRSHVFLESEVKRYDEERRPSGNPNFQRENRIRRTA